MTTRSHSFIATLWLATILIMGAAPSARAASPWMIGEREFNVSAIVIYEQFDEFYKGDVRTDFPFGRWQSVSALAYVEYGLMDWISFDLTIGYVKSFEASQGAMVMEENDGLDDVNLGIKFRILDELRYDSPWVPTVSFRFGGIIEGTYESEGIYFPGIPGGASNGIEGELIAGNAFENGFGITGSLGIRARDQKRPMDWSLNVGIFQSIALDGLWSALDSITFGFAFDMRDSIGGIDIGGPGWNPNRFRELEEDERDIEASAGLSDAGGRYYGVFYARTVGGRNVGIKDIVGVTINSSF